MNWPAAVWLVDFFFPSCCATFPFEIWSLLDALQKKKKRKYFFLSFLVVCFVWDICVCTRLCGWGCIYREREGAPSWGKKRRVCYAIAAAIQLGLPIIPSTPARAPLKFSTKVTNDEDGMPGRGARLHSYRRDARAESDLGKKVTKSDQQPSTLLTFFYFSKSRHAIILIRLTLATCPFKMEKSVPTCQIHRLLQMLPNWKWKSGF